MKGFDGFDFFKLDDFENGGNKYKKYSGDSYHNSGEHYGGSSHSGHHKGGGKKKNKKYSKV